MGGVMCDVLRRVHAGTGRRDVPRSPCRNERSPGSTALTLALAGTGARLQLSHTSRDGSLMLLRLLAVLVLALPVGFGALRFITTGDDSRYVWTAVASIVGACMVIVRSPPRVTLSTQLALGAASLAAGLAAACAALLGATSAPAIAVVALGFGACSAGGLALWHRASAGR